MEEVIVTDKLTKKYGDVTAIKDLDLKVHAGETFGFLGSFFTGRLCVENH